ncbi:MAG: hypothetical protein Unbinned3325contig1000_46 [Prokaryotic dsDNA virus sp.]|nr:MAG: hypothetical protein Unbinned3325contig1000_46 [Prokaryotic dsDNA virus sp.]|tara:strand:+ start:923 stop:1213 length:291 start_codon:yes stop_codon:yes gene_type:complete
MIIRQCDQGYDVVIHLNNKKGMTKTISFVDGSISTIKYPNSKKYFLLVDGEIVKRSDSFVTIEEEYIKEVAKKTSTGRGRIDISKHKLVNNRVVER